MSNDSWLNKILTPSSPAGRRGNLRDRHRDILSRPRLACVGPRLACSVRESLSVNSSLTAGGLRQHSLFRGNCDDGHRQKAGAVSSSSEQGVLRNQALSLTFARSGLDRDMG